MLCPDFIVLFSGRRGVACVYNILPRTGLSIPSFLTFSKLNLFNYLHMYFPFCITHLTVKNHHQRWFDFEVLIWMAGNSIALSESSLCHCLSSSYPISDQIPCFLPSEYLVFSSFLFLLFLPLLKFLSLAVLSISLLLNLDLSNAYFYLNCQ